MKILFSDEHVLHNRIHGISRMMRCVLSGLEDRGHECVSLTDDVNDGDVLLLPANGFVGVKDELHDLLVSDCNIPIVSIIYDIIPYVFNQNKEERYKHALIKTLSWSRNLITISHHSANDIRQHLGYRPDITVIHPGVPFDAPLYEKVQPDDYFLSVGGYGERKGHAELLEAIIQMDQQLIMVGVPFYHDQRTLDLARKAVGRGLLIELCDIPDGTLINLYQYAKALIYPTKYEGFGLPIIEAMACGCPVITTNITATAEAAGEAAYFIEPTTDGIVLALERIDTCRDFFVKEGLKQAAKFNWQEITQLYEKALDKS